MILQHISSQDDAFHATVARVVEELCGAGFLRKVGHAKSIRYFPVLTREEHTARLLEDAVIDSGCSIVPYRTVALIQS